MTETIKDQLETLHRNYLNDRRLPLSLVRLKSIDVLAKVAEELERWHIPYNLDPEWPCHLVVTAVDYRISVYAGGWSETIELAEVDGSPRLQDRDRVYKTARGVVNYLIRTYEMRSMLCHTDH